MTPDPSTVLLQLNYRDDLDVLVGRWGYQPPTSELPPAYRQVRDAALQHGCRFWLQDIRRRTLNDPSTTTWLLTTFFPDMAQHLGGRLFVAYLVGPVLQQAILQRPDFIPAAGDDDKPFVTSFFGDEGAAMQWLLEQQDRSRR